MFLNSLGLGCEGQIFGPAKGSGMAGKCILGQFWFRDCWKMHVGFVCVISQKLKFLD